MAGNMKHSKESKEKMSELRKKYWLNLDKEKYKEHCSKIAENHSRNCQGKFGPDHPGWKGGRWIDKRDGKVYVYVKPGHPSYGYKRHMYEHRYMMEEILGRRLSKNEEVHHKDGIKDHNEYDNFEFVVKKQHYGKAKCPYCGGEFKVK